MTGLLLLYLFLLAAELGLERLNLQHLRRFGGTVPPAFAGAVGQATLRRSRDYAVETVRLHSFESVTGGLLFAVFLFAGPLGIYDRWVASLTGSFVAAGVIFFWGLLLARLILGLPFSIYRTFCLEERYGFNATTVRLWLTDLLKSTLISMLLSGVLTASALWIVAASPELWWLWAWGLFAFFTLLLIYIAPYVIEPLFFKFEPVRREGVEEQIRKITDKAGVAVSRVQQVDASRRSRHSNAYFTGIGKVKRIVLFDTLLEQMDDREIVAILAHELGHWKRHHLLKRLLATEVFSLAALWLAYRLVAWGGLPSLVGLPATASFPAQVVVLAFLGGLAGFFFTPVSSYFSRRHEWQADDDACRLTGEPGQLASALVKLARENLANLHPHPLYAWFHYSHPPIVERVEKLRARS